MKTVEQEAFELERHLVPAPERKNAPSRLLKIYRREAREGVPTGIALHNHTWYVLQTSGQGPYVIAKARANKRVVSRLLRKRREKESRVFKKEFKCENLSK